MDIRVAAYCLVLDTDRRMLLAHWKAANMWTLPGGGIDPGETPAAAAVREVAEETGYDVELDTLLDVGSRVIPGSERFDTDHRDLHAVHVVYRAHLVGGELRGELEGSTDRAGWFTIDEMTGLRRSGFVDLALTHLNGTG